MTYPQIGNVGANAEDEESRRPFLSGFVVKELFGAVELALARDARRTICARHGVPGIADIDTRALVRRLRDGGFQVGVLSTDPARQDEAELVAIARGDAGARRARPRRRGDLRRGLPLERGALGGHRGPGAARGAPDADAQARRLRLRHQAQHPAPARRAGLRRARGARRRRPRDEVLALEPDAVFLSNGPGDPGGRAGDPRARAPSSPRRSRCSASASATRSSASRSAARRTSSSSATTAATSPARTSRPARSRSAPRTTAIAVDADSLRAAGEPVRITHVNLNDGTVEGLAHETRPLFSVQYHPEASPGPHDAALLLRAASARWSTATSRASTVTGAQIAAAEASAERAASATTSGRSS